MKKVSKIKAVKSISSALISEKDKARNAFLNTISSSVKVHGQLERDMTAYAEKLVVVYKGLGITKADIASYSSQGSTKIREGVIGEIDKERVAFKESIDKRGLEKNTGNVYYMRLFAKVKTGFGIVKPATTKGKKKTGTKKESKSGQVIQVDKSNIGTLTPATKIGFLQAIVSFEQEQTEANYNVAEVIKGLNLAIAGYEKKVIKPVK
jgi:hypothetical protein